MNVKSDNFLNTGSNLDWLVSGDISQIPILKNAVSNLLKICTTNGKKATVDKLGIGDE